MIEVDEMRSRLKEPKMVVSIRPVALYPGLVVHKLWLSHKAPGGFLSTHETISEGPFLSLTGDWMVKFEGSFCSYLASLCSPTVSV